MKKIADVSVYQGNIKWDIARADLEIVILRASIGYNIDTKYLYNATNCKIPFGVYHYFKAGTKEEAKKEAEFFYKAATQNNLAPLFFCPDIEYKTQTAATTKIVCQTILDTLKAFGAKKVGLYIGQSRYPYVKDIVNKFDFIWIPRHGKDNGIANEAYKPIYTCDMWQYTSKGMVNGIKTKVDLNILCGNKTLNWYIMNEEEKKKTSFFYLGRRTLRIGNEGADVCELQNYLNNNGYNCGKADGKFGEKTKNALMKYQKDNKLSVDGVCGKHTFAKIIG